MVMTEFIKIKISLHADQENLKDLNYPKIMEKFRALIRAEKAGEEFKASIFNSDAAVIPEKKKYMCSYHEENILHSTENCLFLNKEKKEYDGGGNRSRGRGRRRGGRRGSNGRGTGGRFSGVKNQGGRYHGRGT